MLQKGSAGPRLGGMTMKTVLFRISISKGLDELISRMGTSLIILVRTVKEEDEERRKEEKERTKKNQLSVQCNYLGEWLTNKVTN